MDIENEISVLLEKLDVMLKLAEEGLLKSERYYETKYATEDRLKELAPYFDERERLLIEKNISHWRNVPKSGIFIDMTHTADSMPLRQLLLDLRSGIAKKKEGVDIKKEIGGMKLPAGFAVGPLMFSANGKTADAIMGPAIVAFDYGITNSLNRLNKSSLPPDEFQSQFNAQIEDLISDTLIYFQNRLKPITKTNVGQFNSIDKCIKEYARHSIDLHQLCDTKFLLGLDSVRGRKHHSQRRYDADYSVDGVSYDTVEKLRELNRRAQKEVHKIDDSLATTHKEYDVKVTQTPNSVSISFTANNHAFDLTRGGKIVPKKPNEPDLPINQK